MPIKNLIAEGVELQERTKSLKVFGRKVRGPGARGAYHAEKADEMFAASKNARDPKRAANLLKTSRKHNAKVQRFYEKP